MTYPRLLLFRTRTRASQRVVGHAPGARFPRSLVVVCLLLSVGCASAIDKSSLVPVSDVLNAETAAVTRGEASYEYVIAQRDLLNITVFLRSGVTPVIALSDTRVNLKGDITFPFVGTVRAEGLTIEELHAEIEDVLAGYYIAPVISVEVASPVGHRVFVLGEVTSPGIYTSDGRTTAVEAILEAGGFSNDADMDNVLLLRSALRGSAGPVLTTLNLKQAFQSANLTHNVILRQDDLVIVPPRGIARLGRTMSHYFAIAAPFFGLMESVVTLLILTNVVK